MEAISKDIARLEKLAAWDATAAKGKAPSFVHSLDALLDELRAARTQLNGDVSGSSISDSSAMTIMSAAALETIRKLPLTVEACRKSIDLRQKELYNAHARVGKALDKAFPNPLPDLSEYIPQPSQPTTTSRSATISAATMSPTLFSSPTERSALERAIAQHYLRTGHFEIAHTLLQEVGGDDSDMDVSTEEAQFAELYKTLVALRNDDIQPALAWVETNRSFLASRSSSLEFDLHRSHYLHLLTSSSTTSTTPSSLSSMSSSSSSALVALTYARTHFSRFQPVHASEISQLLGALAYLPTSRLASSPYASLLSSSGPSSLATLCNTFSALWCTATGLPRSAPLLVLSSLGPYALTRIEKAKKVLRLQSSAGAGPATTGSTSNTANNANTTNTSVASTGWATREELPVEIPLPAENRYHSVFTCPVSKEQASERNPPMMISCGHVICMESLEKLAKSHGDLKCPYCPVQSRLDNAIRVHF